MRRLLFLLLPLSFALKTYAQKIRFTDTSNEWTEFTSNPNLPNGISFHSIYYTSSKIDSNKKWMITNSNELMWEDTQQRKVYYKSTNGFFGDTSIHLLYDYNLKIGDSFISILHESFSVDTFIHTVNKIDSVSINGSLHKIWSFVNSYSNNPHYYYPGYRVVEGIGCINGLSWPLMPGEFETMYGLICFTNNSNITTVPNPDGGNLLDAKTCTSSIMTTSLISNTISIIPNPANETSIIRLPYNMHSGTLTIVNALGQTVLQKEIADKTEFPIGDLRLPGIYFYRVTDKDTNQMFTGKFMFQ